MIHKIWIEYVYIHIYIYTNDLYIYINDLFIFNGLIQWIFNNKKQHLYIDPLSQISKTFVSRFSKGRWLGRNRIDYMAYNML